VTAVSFFVVGTPAPQGSKRFVGNGRMVESSKALAPWRAAVAWVASQHPLTPGPVEVTLDFALARPRSAPKSRLWPDRKPDLDKLERGCLDALTAAAVIEDDARVVRLSSWKRYALPGEATGVGVTIRPAVVAELRGPMGETA
jgi:crossover junction endodeoxyribonuclease RusA